MEHTYIDEVVSLQLELDGTRGLRQDKSAIERERYVSRSLWSNPSVRRCYCIFFQGPTVKSSIRSPSSPQSTASHVRFFVSTARNIRAPFVLASLTYSSGLVDCSTGQKSVAMEGGYESQTRRLAHIGWVWIRGSSSGGRQLRGLMCGICGRSSSLVLRSRPVGCDERR